MTNESTITKFSRCSNCGRLAQLGKDIPVVSEDGTSFEIAICDDETCQTHCIPVQPDGFFVLESTGQRVRWSVGTCDECGDEQVDTTTMLQGETEDGYTDWLCAYCAARLQRDDTITQALLNILKGAK